MTRGRDRRQEKARRILQRNNAQEILSALEKLDERRKQFATRWLWELIQNARDFPDPERPMKIRVSASLDKIHFAHNGRPFSEEEVLSLIYHGSTKQENPEQLGKFGTGFLSSHLLSRKVTVQGVLLEENGERRNFEFELDRSGKDASELSAAMERSHDSFETSLESRNIASHECTEFTYNLDQSDEATGQLETQFQIESIPYVLAFDETIEQVEIVLGEKRTIFEREAFEKLDDETTVAVVKQDSERVRLAIARDDSVAVAVPIRRNQDGKIEVLRPGSMPTLFLFLPLVRSSEIGLPVVLNSRQFMPTEERDGLRLESDGGPQSDSNRKVLESASDVIVRLASSCSAAGCVGLHRFLDIREPSEAVMWLGDKTWYRQFQQELIQKLAEVPLVNSRCRTVLPANKAVLAVGDTRLSWERTFEFGSGLFSKQIASDEIAEECSRTAEGWSQLLGADAVLVRSCLLDSTRLLSSIRETENLEGLSTALGIGKSDTIAWLNRLVSAIPDSEKRTSFDGLLPDQSKAGVFRSHESLARDMGIDDVLKDVLESLGDSIRERLLHNEITNPEILIARVEQQDKLVTDAKDRLKKRADELGGSPELNFRSACLRLFGWLASNSRWSDLRDTLPVLVLDRDGNESIGATSPRNTTLLLPRTTWPEQAKVFWDAFPPGSILADDYSSVMEDQTQKTAAENGLVIDRLAWNETIEVTDLQRYAVEPELEGDSHSPEDTGFQLSVGKIALVGTEHFLESLRSRSRAARFLRFVLEYAVRVDDSWRRHQQVACECGRKHMVVPSDWLAWIRNTQWVPRRKTQEYLTTESLAPLTREDAKLADAVTTKDAEQLLELAGINVLEQALLSMDETRRSELRRKLAQLTKLASENPKEVDQLMRDIEARREAAERWRENQDIGKEVERLVREMLAHRLRGVGIAVTSNFVGYDVAAHFAGTIGGEDVGAIDIAVGTLIAKVEIKATRGDSVSMSYAQGDAAAADQQHYWLCVVHLTPQDTVGSLTDSRIEAVARFVPRIGGKLASSRNGIQRAVKDALAVACQLEHVEDVRYGVSRQLWEHDGAPSTTFVDSLVREVLAKVT